MIRIKHIQETMGADAYLDLLILIEENKMLDSVKMVRSFMHIDLAHAVKVVRGIAKAELNKDVLENFGQMEYKQQ